MMKNIFAFGAGHASASGDVKKNTAPTTRKEDVFVSSEEACDTSASNAAADSRKDNNCPSTASDGTAANCSVIVSSEQLSPSTARTTATESPSVLDHNAEKAKSTVPMAQPGVEASSVDGTELPSTEETNVAKAPEGTDAATCRTEEASHAEKPTPQKTAAGESAAASGTTASDGAGIKTKTSVAASKRNSKEEKKRKATRTKDDIDAENKKLRSDLTNMRRTLNATQEQLSCVVSAIAKIFSMGGVPKEAYDAWKTTESKIFSHSEAMDAKWQTTAFTDGSGDVGVNGRQYGRQQQWVQWQQRQQQQNGQSHEVGITPYEVALHYNSTTRHSQAGTSQRPMGQQQSQAPAGGTPRRAGGKRRLRREQHGSQIEAQTVATRRKDNANDAKTAAQASLAQNIRNELRMAETPADLSKAIEKANKSGMAYEASLGTRKLDKLKQGSATAKPKSKANKTTESPSESATTCGIPVCSDQRAPTFDTPAAVSLPTAA